MNVVVLVLTLLQVRAHNSFTVPLEKRPRKTKHRQLAFEYEVDLINQFNFQYLTQLWVGSHLQKMTFIIDTGSQWTWIPSADCPDEQCINDHYRYSESQGYYASQVEKEIFYGSGYVKGKIVNDDISINGRASA